MAGGRAEETSPIFVFRVTSYYVHRGSGQAREYPRRWLSVSSRAKAFTLQGTHRRFIGDSAFHTSLRGAPLLGGKQQKKRYHQILQKVQRSDTTCLYVLYILLYSSMYFVDYCCFHLDSGASTAVGLFTTTYRTTGRRRTV